MRAIERFETTTPAETISRAVEFLQLQRREHGLDAVGIGSYVTVVERGTRDDEVYQIVGSAEADPARGRISNESPVGRALLGKRVGEEATVKTPDGVRYLKISEIR